MLSNLHIHTPYNLHITPHSTEKGLVGYLMQKANCEVQKELWTAGCKMYTYIQEVPLRLLFYIAIAPHFRLLDSLLKKELADNLLLY